LADEFLISCDTETRALDAPRPVREPSRLND
jgi:hypothetical protein